MSKIKNWSLDHEGEKLSNPIKGNPFRIETERVSFNKYAREEAFGRRGQIDDPEFIRNPLD